MTTDSRIHILHVPTRLVGERPDGEPRWCFMCRGRVLFRRYVYAPIDPMSYYGPNATVKCERGHVDGDLFPGRSREWIE